ncbi:hypothetical protein JYT50_00835 [bacterium AH-315-A23]|nr:hypothetical protein [bacterium AH-315-A23]
MRKIFIITVLTIIFSVNQISAQFKFVKPVITVIKKDNYTIVQLNIDIDHKNFSQDEIKSRLAKIDNRGNIVSRTKAEGIVKSANIDSESLKSQVCSRLKKQAKLYIRYPKFFNEVLELFSSQEEKNKAIEIYDSYNAKHNVLVSHSRSFGLTSITSKIEIRIPLIIEKETELILESLNMKIYDIYYRTEKVTISLKN